jgi:flagellar basal body-associated protein FliL
MIEQRYFIIPLSMELMFNLIGKIVGNFQEQRTSLDNTLVLVKLAEEDTNDYPELANYTEYNRAQILTILQTPEWSNPFPII